MCDEAASRQIDVVVLDEGQVSKEIVSLIRKVGLSCLRQLGDENACVEVALAGDSLLAELNQQYRGRCGPTDVLSFPLTDEEDESSFDCEGHPEPLLGQVVLNVRRAQEQAEAYGHSFQRELCYLLVHGILHLCGYDHHSEDDRKSMRRKEEEVLGAAGLPRR